MMFTSSHHIPVQSNLRRQRHQQKSLLTERWFQRLCKAQADHQCWSESARRNSNCASTWEREKDNTVQYVMNKNIFQSYLSPYWRFKHTTASKQQTKNIEQSQGQARKPSKKKQKKTFEPKPTKRFRSLSFRDKSFGDKTSTWPRMMDKNRAPKK